MGTLDSLIINSEKDRARYGAEDLVNALTETLHGVSASRVEEIRSLQAALREAVAALSKGQGKASGETLTAVSDASEAIQSAVVSMMEQLQGLEAQVIAEIRAIKFPKIPAPEKVDFSPVFEAINRIPTPERVEIPDFPDFPDMPKPKAIVPIRNRNTSLVERYEIEY